MLCVIICTHSTSWFYLVHVKRLIRFILFFFISARKRSWILLELELGLVLKHIQKSFPTWRRHTDSTSTRILCRQVAQDSSHLNFQRDNGAQRDLVGTHCVLHQLSQFDKCSLRHSEILSPVFVWEFPQPRSFLPNITLDLHPASTDVRLARCQRMYCNN